MTGFTGDKFEKHVDFFTINGGNTCRRRIDVFYVLTILKIIPQVLTIISNIDMFKFSAVT
jgi:hypothetical protein